MNQVIDGWTNGLCVLNLMMMMMMMNRGAQEAPNLVACLGGGRLHRRDKYICCAQLVALRHVHSDPKVCEDQAFVQTLGECNSQLLCGCVFHMTKAMGGEQPLCGCALGHNPPDVVFLLELVPAPRQSQASFSWH